MLIEKLNAASQVLHECKEMQDGIRLAEQFKRNILEVQKAASTIDRALIIANEASEQKLLPLTMPSSLQNNLLSTIRNLLEQLEDSPPYLDRETVLQFTHGEKELKSYLDRLWQEAVAKEAEQLVSSLGTFGPFIRETEEASRLQKEIGQLKKELPHSPEEVVRFARNLQRGRELISEIGDDPEIRSFINKVLEKRASLKDVTAKVLHWIKEHHLENRLKITL